MATVPEEDFGAALLKIEWAKKHIADLTALINRFCELDFYNLSVELDPNSAQRVVRFETSPIPVDFALLIGDAVHNLRCALDYAFNLLVRASRDSKSRLVFPVHEDWDNLEGELAKDRYRTIKAAFPEAGNVILNKINPTRSGNRLVWGVCKLDNLDKHNLIIPVLQAVALRDVVLTSGDQVIGFVGRLQVHGAGSMVLGRSDGSEIKIHRNTKAEFEVVFGKDQVFENEPVVATLIQATQAVSKAVEAFLETFGENVGAGKPK